MRTAFLNTLTDLMRKDKDIITITADMGFSVFEDVQKEFPTRFINTGVAEQSSIGIATGLALSGFKVYFYAQAPFATMRCFEQIRLDVAFNKVSVKIVGVASGFHSNQLGVSHFALEDVALMRLLPNMTIFTPGDPVEATWATNEAYKIDGPTYIRLTKSGSPIVHSQKTNFKVGKGVILKQGKDACILVSGNLLPLAIEIHEFLLKKNISITIVSMPTVKPIDDKLILQLAKNTKNIFTLEEHSILGGLGSIVAEILASNGTSTMLNRLGAPDKFTNITGSHEYLLSKNELSIKSLVRKILTQLSRK